MSIKILLADDSITIQKVVGIIFGGEEYSLTVVDNGKAAVEKAREINPDVLLIDALMPGMSGYEVCEAVRATPAISSKPILLLTGSFEPFDENKAKSCGDDDVLAKPFESQQIVTKVKELFDLGLSRANSPSAAAPAAETLVPPPLPEAAEASAVSGDIWGAFTAPEEPEMESATAAVSTSTDNSIGSQWVPLEEETIEFVEDASPEQPAAPMDVTGASIEESMFGDTEFGMITPAPTIPEVESTAPMEAAPAVAQTTEAPLVAIASAAPALSEEQLREALAAASKDVIERIIWEVVPDLAEVLIKEAIRKIKEGQ